MVTERKRVHPYTMSANGLWNVFTQRKKYHIACGACRHSYTDKVSFLTDMASSLCPCCGAQNTWSHSEFSEWYDRNVLNRGCE